MTSFETSPVLSEVPEDPKTPLKSPKKGSWRDRSNRLGSLNNLKKRWPTQMIPERFWSHVDKTGLCWLWTGYCIAQRYGVFNLKKGKWLFAHRFAYELAKGPIPYDKDVLHTCDNPPCVNPDHLWLGTHAENMADKVKKGRQCKGEQMWNAKLTEIQAKEILSSDKPIPLLALIFDVSARTIQLIRNGKTWKHLGGSNE